MVDATDTRTGTTDERHFCPVCRHVIVGLLARAPSGRRARCPHCGSLERHRFLAVLLGSIEPLLPPAPRILEVAPSAYTAPLLRALEPSHHVSLDFDPGADKRTVDVRASLTQAPFADASLDLIVCFHVLEHIPDDRRAMAEIARTLGPRGIGVIQFPWRPNAETDEDPDAPVEERIRRFGQHDHVRFYGGDCEDRLMEAGLSVCRVEPRAFLGHGLHSWIAADPYPIWLVQPLGGGFRLVSRPNAMADAMTSMATEVKRLEAAEVEDSAALLAARRELGRTRRRLRQQRSRADAAEATVQAQVVRRLRTLRDHTSARLQAGRRST
jgi:SAM-dependent methyltransferase